MHSNRQKREVIKHRHKVVAKINRFCNTKRFLWQTEEKFVRTHEFKLTRWSVRVILVMINYIRGVQVAICYKKLWKLLIDRDMKKKDLQVAAGISSASITKLAKNENVNTEVLQKVCIALNCDISDIMEMIPDNNQ